MQTGASQVFTLVFTYFFPLEYPQLQWTFSSQLVLPILSNFQFNRLNWPFFDRLIDCIYFFCAKKFQIFGKNAMTFTLSPSSTVQKVSDELKNSRTAAALNCQNRVCCCHVFCQRKARKSISKAFESLNLPCSILALNTLK